MRQSKWNRGRRGLAVVSAGLLAAVTLAACGSGSDDKADSGSSGGLMTLRYEHSKGLAGVPIEVAYEQGYFKKHGLKMVDKVISPGPAGVAALGRQFDILQTSNQSILDAVAAGRKDLRFFGGLGLSTKDNPAFPVYATKASGIKSWADLGGKTAGYASLTGFATTTTDYLAKKAGVDIKSIKKVIVPFATFSDQLKSKRIDFGWAIKPYAAVIAKDGYTYLGDPTIEATGRDEMLASVHATTAEFAKKNPKALESFQAALNDAMTWIKANPQETKDLATKWLNLPPEVMKIQPMEDIKINITAADLEPMLAVFKDMGMLQNLPSIESLMVGPAAAK